ncbi:unnamed protein product [Gulo gulo]|uniref:Bone marrow stromal antigen 2 n=1 Tax=Gulo gulo TaxID=48420 RepID=A0A9X9LQG6_GULGU|nr:unnamed protein product [Gulo gulo]
MAPTFYHHWPEPVTEKSGSMVQSQCWGRRGLSIVLMTSVVLVLSVALIIFAVRANSKACKEGLLAEQECRNVTRLLELQLAQTRQDLVGAMDEAATCNQTVVSNRDFGRGPCGCTAPTGLDGDGETSSGSPHRELGFPARVWGTFKLLSGAGLGQGFKRPQSTQIPTRMWEESPTCLGRASSCSLHQSRAAEIPSKVWDGDFTASERRVGLRIHPPHPWETLKCSHGS